MNVVVAPPPGGGREAGFSLVEMLVTLAILGILANIAIPFVQDHQYRGKAAKVIEDYLVVRAAVYQFYADKGRFPQDAAAGQEPSELTLYLKGRVQWTQPGGLVYDWESWDLTDATGSTQTSSAAGAGGSTQASTQKKSNGPNEHAAAQAFISTSKDKKSTSTSTTSSTTSGSSSTSETDASSGSGAALVGLTVTAGDPRLIEAVAKVYKGTLFYTLETTTSFAVEPPR